MTADINERDAYSADYRALRLYEAECQDDAIELTSRIIDSLTPVVEKGTVKDWPKTVLKNCLFLKGLGFLFALV